MRVEKFGDATLMLGDCREILPTLGHFDLLLTDPPYGIGEAAGKNKSRHNESVATDYGNKYWDNSPPSLETIQCLLSSARHQIIFGGNYFNLPPTSCFLVWDKENGKSDFADAELAWSNLKKAVRLKRHRWNGMWQADMFNKEERFHPTQKPLPVMAWCISQAPESVETILDPFMGSGTTGLAAIKAGKKFTGIEIDPDYFETACRRVEAAANQGVLF